MPNSGRDIDILEHCQYVMGTFDFHKLLNMNLVLPASGGNHGNNHRPFFGMEMKFIVFNSG